MRKDVRVKIATAAITGVFVTLGLVWQAEAFFSRDQWFNSAPASGSVSQAVSNPAPSAPIVTGGGVSTNPTVITSLTGGQQPTVVNPEPSTVMLLASGLVGMGLWRRKQRTN